LYRLIANGAQRVESRDKSPTLEFLEFFRNISHHAEGLVFKKSKNLKFPKNPKNRRLPWATHHAEGPKSARQHDVKVLKVLKVHEGT
jgi:hypothetical protein